MSQYIISVRRSQAFSQQGNLLLTSYSATSPELNIRPQPIPLSYPALAFLKLPLTSGDDL